MSDRLPVNEMPYDLWHVLLQRGYAPTDEMNFADALEQWFAWELEDGKWAGIVLRLQSDFASRLKNQT